jgi:hypothetical protein
MSKVLKQALEAFDDRSSLLKWQAAREALRQAIAELESQEPVDWVDSVMEQAQVFASAWSIVGSRFAGSKGLENAEQAKAELRAMLTHPPQRTKRKPIAMLFGSLPVYDTPPQRTWVGLTDDEIDNINYTSAHMLAREVEAKLKEKNND